MIWRNRELIFVIAGFAATLAAAFFGVELFRRWSIRRNIVDHPNERSSHAGPTPRGGGVVIMAVTLSIFSIYSFLQYGAFPWSFVAGALIVGLVSWLDDVYSVSPVWRLAAHSVAASILILQFGGFAKLYVPVAATEFEPGLLGLPLAFAWIVWLINAYNFMDGIDGMAGLQAVITGFAWLVFGIVFVASGTAFLGGLIAFGAAGFLFHNWQPAKIFLGDTGSSFLGFAFAAAPLMASAENPSLAAKLPLISALFVWLFVLDTVITFLRRLFGKRPFWRPHREHSYQQMVISGKSHATVSKIYGVSASIITGATILAARFGGLVDLVAIFLAVAIPIFVFRLVKKKIDVTI